jgi:hypothetical protein
MMLIRADKNYGLFFAKQIVKTLTVKTAARVIE